MAVTRSQEHRQEMLLQTFILCAAVGAILLLIANCLGWLGENEKNLIHSLLGGAATLVVAAFAWRKARKRYLAEIEEERFSISHVLALGYVRNFIYPVVAELLEREGNEISLWVCLPDSLEQLDEDAIKLVRSKVKAAGFKERVLELQKQGTRIRDVLTIEAGGSRAFFDFPGTLRSLTALLDYRADRDGGMTAEEKKEICQFYITQFKTEVERLVKDTDSDLADNVHFTDAKLSFLKENKIS